MIESKMDLFTGLARVLIPLLYYINACKVGSSLGRHFRGFFRAVIAKSLFRGLCELSRCGVSVQFFFFSFNRDPCEGVSWKYSN